MQYVKYDIIYIMHTGAIKFGDKLTKQDCKLIIDQLYECELPFQCAHNRPTVFPLIRLRNPKVYSCL